MSSKSGHLSTSAIPGRKEKIPVDRIVHSYGDLLFDLCESLLASPAQALLAFRAILRRIKATPHDAAYESHERAWVLRVAFETLKKQTGRHGKTVSASEQIEVDAAKGVASKMKHFDRFFHRLTPDDQILLLLRDKYGLPYGEIASAMATPEGSLKMQRQNCLRTLEEWLWESQ
jgi:DNA-directed RNA polymerase specialized sigma24 family protein